MLAVSGIGIEDLEMKKRIANAYDAAVSGTTQLRVQGQLTKAAKRIYRTYLTGPFDMVEGGGSYRVNTVIGD